MGNKGTTLVELVLILVLLGILALSVRPFANTSPASLDAAARKVRSDLAYVQQLAMTTGARHGAVFSTTTRTYTLFRGNDPFTFTTVADPLTKQTTPEDLRRFGDVIVAKNSSVVFDSAGRPVPVAGAPWDGAGILRNSLGGTRSLGINTNTGLVEITNP